MFEIAVRKLRIGILAMVASRLWVLVHFWNPSWPVSKETKSFRFYQKLQELQFYKCFNIQKAPAALKPYISDKLSSWISLLVGRLICLNSFRHRMTEVVHYFLLEFHMNVFITIATLFFWKNSFVQFQLIFTLSPYYLLLEQFLTKKLPVMLRCMDSRPQDVLL